LYLIELSSAFFVICFFVITSFSAIDAKNIVLSGNIMKVNNNANLIISSGNSRVVNNTNIITSDEMTYNTKDSILLAYGNVKMISKISNDELLECYGTSVKYNVNNKNISFRGYNAMIKYSAMKLFKSPLVLNAREINVDINHKVLTAYDSVEAITPFGKIYSDKAIFDKKASEVIFKKCGKRPLANVFYNGQKGTYKADEIIFYNSDNNKKIIMNGFVVGEVEMEHKQ
jgi:lipopolysaccharide assembly outer membrane protein LptD (OstA)